MKKTCLTSKLHHLTLEKMVIGVEEPILIKGIGELVAKIDSGNSGYNVIHGEDIIVQGDIINFKCYNKDNQERRVSKKIKDTIKINIGGGHIQDRYVIELDVQFGGENYKKIPFSISNRSDNEHKVLISKDFIGNELQALIDVTKDNIADDKINIDYVSEGFTDTDKKGRNLTKKWGEDIKREANEVEDKLNVFANGTKKQRDFLNKARNVKKGIWGIEQGTPNNTPKFEQKYIDEVNSLANLENQMKADDQLIKRQLQKQQAKIKDLLNVSIESNNINVVKLFDYTGNIFDENLDPDFSNRLKTVLEKYKHLKETGLTENTLFEKNNTEGIRTLLKTFRDENEKKNSVEDQLIGSQEQKNPQEMDYNEVREVLEELVKRNRTIFYIINFVQDANGAELKQAKDFKDEIKKVIYDECIRIIQTKNWSLPKFKALSEKLANILNNQNTKGLFAIATMPANKRKIDFFSNTGLFTDKDSEEVVYIPEDLFNEYQALNNEFLTMAEELGQAADSINIDNLQALINLINEVMKDKQATSEDIEEVETLEDLFNEYQALNNKYLTIAEGLGQPGDSINIDDLQALIDLITEVMKDKRAEELGQVDPGDAVDSTDYGNIYDVENEERKIK